MPDTKGFIPDTSGCKILEGELGGVNVSGLRWFNARALIPLVLTSSEVSWHALLTISSKPCARPSGLGFWILDDITDPECDVAVPHVVVVTVVVVVGVAMEVVVVAVAIKRLA